MPFADLAANRPLCRGDGRDRDRPSLSEAGKLAQERAGAAERGGSDQTIRRVLENGVVRSSPGFAEGFRAIAEGGWVGVSADPEYGGMGLPQALNMAVAEMMSGACLSLQLNPLLTQGQIEALEHHASDDLKALYLPKLISGEWSGTMNLTEPGAGSDVGALTTRAEPAGDGTYRISRAEDLHHLGRQRRDRRMFCHLVLARSPGRAQGDARHQPVHGPQADPRRAG